MRNAGASFLSQPKADISPLGEREYIQALQTRLEEFYFRTGFPLLKMLAGASTSENKLVLIWSLPGRIMDH